MFGWDDAIGAGIGIAGAIAGNKQQKKANQLNERALAQRQGEYDQRAPLRNLGMQELGQIERPIDMGNTSYNPTNPFAKARGPSGSTANMGNWGEMTFQAPPETSSAERDQATSRAGLVAGITNDQHMPASVRAKMLAQLGNQPIAPPKPTTSYGWQA